MYRHISRRSLALTTTAIVSTSAYFTYTSLQPTVFNDADKIPVTQRRPGPLWSPPTRKQMLDHLKSSGRSIQSSQSSGGGGGGGSGIELVTSPDSKPLAVKKEDQDEGIFDLLVVGGGATGTGVAVDAASRGLKVACVERDDFSSGTSSKSTKLVHGGVRYLQKAVFELDYGQFGFPVCPHVA
jgi:glycerol-3-phosphate dehydrogenase